MVPDPSGLAAQNPGAPQSWNLYAYVLNNPLKAVDPTGLYCVYLDDAGNNIEEIDDDKPNRGVASSGPMIIEQADPENDCATNGGYWIEGTFGAGSRVFVNSDAGTVTGVGYDSGGNAELSNAGAIGSNAFGGWTQTFSASATAAYFDASAANNANQNWGDAFTKNLFSVKNFIDEFKQGGCVNVFGSATVDALNPLSPSLSSASEATTAVLAASKYNAAIQYAASAPNYLGGTGLIYPMKSSVVRSMVADANATAASGGLMTVDLALAQGFATEMHSIASGKCH
jgi:hypothetical protein